MRPLVLALCAAASIQAADYKLRATPDHIAWGYYSAAAKPVLRIQSGDVVDIQTVSGNPERLIQAGLKPDLIEPELKAVYEQATDKGPGGHLLTGPIYVEGAQPGDVLEVRILEIRPSVPYAYNGFRPGAGLLTDGFTESRMKIIPLDLEKKVARFALNIEVPIRPFFGSMGVAPAPAAGRINSAPPGLYAGNLDNRELVAGTTLFIPVHAAGALFEVGDGHAGQGDGEVDITAMETSLWGKFQFVLRKDLRLTWPRAETPTHWIVMGLDPDLNLAMKIAAREAIDLLMKEQGLSRDDAYMLTSIGVNFAVTQVVDGTRGIHGMIPKSLFKQ
ncbi:MAG: acetamidase/formamidase family protein [Acidobacteria bacterium]|nr:acetamidase/formamidase family protein [Acidobacteriota bacterium]